MRKSKTLLILGTLMLTTPIYAQNWKDKLNSTKEKINNKLNETGGQKDYSSEFDGVEFEDMMTYVDSWNGKKSVKSCYYSHKDMRYYNEDPVDIAITKNGEEYEMVQIGSFKYVPIVNSDSKRVRGFKGHTTSRDLYFSHNKLVTFHQNEDSHEVTVFNVYGEREPYGKIKAEIAAYINYTDSLIYGDVQAANKERKRIAKEKAEARKAKYGLHDKEIKSVKIIANVPEVNGNFLPYSFDIETTLKDGTIITTADQGFFEDYKVTTTAPRNFEGRIEGKFVPGDQIVLRAVSIHDPSIVAETKVSLDYNTDAIFYIYGSSWSRSAGEDGDDIELSIKADKHAVTGKTVLRVKTRSTANRADGLEFTIDPSQTIVVKAHGGKGGSDEDRFYNGGNGGNITVYKDPNVESFKINYSCSGGLPGGRTASAGRDGKYREVTQKVEF